MMSSASTRQTKVPREKPTKSNAETNKNPDGPAAKLQATAEQIRLAQMISDSKDLDEPEHQAKIRQIMELTGKTSDEAIVALHDCDNDPNRAIDMLLEGDNGQGEWETSVKKKKSRPVAAAVKPGDSNSEAVNNNKENRGGRNDRGYDRDLRDPNRTRGRGPPRLSRGRGRENEKNEKNLEERRSFERNFDYQGRGRMMNGPGRLSRGRGPRIRTFQNRGSSHGGGMRFPRAIETWGDEAEQTEANTGESAMNVGNWDGFPITEDWDNEDWTGNLSETKVFTPSTAVVVESSSFDNLAVCGADGVTTSLDLSPVVQKTGSLPASAQSPSSAFLEAFSQKIETATVERSKPPGVVSSSNTQSLYQPMPASTYDASSLISGSASQSSGYSSSSIPSFSASSIPAQGAGVSGQLSTQTVISKTAASALPHQGFVQGGNSASSHSSSVATSHQPPLPARPKPQRTRTPAPTKVPSMGVEMPDDVIAALDVQFGSLEFGVDPSSLEFVSGVDNLSVTAPAPGGTMIQNHMGSVSSATSAASLGSLGIPMSVPSLSTLGKTSEAGIPSVYQAQTPASVTIAPTQTQMTTELPSQVTQSSLTPPILSQISGSEPLSYTSQAERKVISAFSSPRAMQSSSLEGTIASSKSDQPPSLSSFVVPTNSAVSGVSGGSSAGSSSGNSVLSYQTPYVSQKSSAAYTSSSSSGSQSHGNLVTSMSGYPNNGTINSSQAPVSVNQLASTVPTSIVGYGASTVSFPSAVQSASSNPAMAAAVPTVYGASQVQQQQMGVASTVSSYASQGQGYASGPVLATTTYAPVTTVGIAQSAYGGGSSLHTPVHPSTKFAPTMGASSKDCVLEQTQSQHVYDGAHTTSAANLTSLTSTSTSSVSASLGLGSTSAINSNAKSMVSSGKAGLQSLPPGVPAVLSHQYIMGQTSLPFYGLQHPMYTYEDIQVLQQRLPLTGYYDLTFPQPTTLTGRDAGLASVAYSGTDSKFSRGDTNSSPVPTTMSQQQSSTQQHQQTFLSPTAIPHGYGYAYYPGSMMASSFPQYGTPIFPVPPTANAHGATTVNNQFQKQTAYSSHGYASGYDNLSQSQDYSKSGYGTSSQSQNKGMTISSGGSGNSGVVSDMTGSVYGKQHTQLAKSFDKPGFHAGTPPPFNLAGTQAGPMGAPSTAYAQAATPFIPMMTHHQQHHSTMLHLHQESQASASQRGGPNSGHNKPNTSNKQNYNGSNYWVS